MYKLEEKVSTISKTLEGLQEFLCTLELEVEYEPRDVVLMDGSTRKGVLVPSWWTQMQADTAVSHYCQGDENMMDVFHRVARWVSSQVDEKIADSDLVFECLNMMMYHGLGLFNSPMQYNAGVQTKPQISACFISDVEDSIESIMDWTRREACIFKGGSGSGCNPNLRGKGEPLSRKGTSSGSVSFIKALDAFAGVVKSGGRNRRAARMVVMDHDHPDIMEFITVKAEEEKKAQVLIDGGYSADEARRTIAFQNGNHSVRLTDDFMLEVKGQDDLDDSEDVTLKWRGPHSQDLPEKTVKVSDMWNAIAEATRACGDPGVHYQDTINRMRTTVEKIRASNPCSELFHCDNTSCNLASINLIKAWRVVGGDQVKFYELLQQLTTLFIVCQDAVIDNASYPSEAIDHNTKHYRPLGLNYTNLGAWLMSRGIAYDSEKGEKETFNITAWITGIAWQTSINVAEEIGSAPYLQEDGEQRRMEDALIQLEENVEQGGKFNHNPEPDVTGLWRHVLNKLGQQYPRNSQVTLMAPNGTISFIMGYESTGIEPVFSLVTRKELVGGKVDIQMPWRAITEGLKAITRKTGSGLPNVSEESLLKVAGFPNLVIEGFPFNIPYGAEVDWALTTAEKEWLLRVISELPEEQKKVFACAMPNAVLGISEISPSGHLRIMAAAQQTLSGAISKTVNLPESATVEDIKKVYLEGWSLGLKALAVYRNNSKVYQPVTAVLPEEEETIEEGEEYFDVTDHEGVETLRLRLPRSRPAVVRKLTIGDFKGYMILGIHPSTLKVLEVFLETGKSGSLVNGFANAFAIVMSMALQYNIPLDVFVDKFRGTSFAPQGYTGDKDFPYANSIVDYVVRIMEAEQARLDKAGANLNEMLDSFDENLELKEELKEIPTNPVKPTGSILDAILSAPVDGKLCLKCATPLIPDGKCGYCPSCKSSPDGCTA